MTVFYGAAAQPGRWPPNCLGFQITHTHTSTSHQLVAECAINTTNTHDLSTIRACDPGTQAHALDRRATGIGQAFMFISFTVTQLERSLWKSYILRLILVFFILFYEEFVVDTVDSSRKHVRGACGCMWICVVKGLLSSCSVRTAFELCPVQEITEISICEYWQRRQVERSGNFHCYIKAAAWYCLPVTGASLHGY
jgi:hypothetical protein